MTAACGLVPIERIERAILLVRGHTVMLDADLAVLYGAETKALNRAVKRHGDRFSGQLHAPSHGGLGRSIKAPAGASSANGGTTLRCQFGTLEARGGRHYRGGLVRPFHPRFVRLAP